MMDHVIQLAFSDTVIVIAGKTTQNSPIIAPQITHFGHSTAISKLQEQPYPGPHEHTGNHTVSTYFARAYLRNGERMGLNKTELLLYAAIPEQYLDQGENRLAPYQLARLLHKVMVDADDEFMGLTRQRCRFGVFTLLAEHLITCDTLGQALEESQRFYRLVTGAVEFRLRREQHLTHFSLTLTAPEKDPDSVLMELLMLVWHRFPSWLIGEVIPLQAVHLTMPAPVHSQEYRLLFPCISHFGQKHNALVLPSEYLDYPIHRNEEDLKQYLAKVPLVWFRKQNFVELQTQRVLQILKQSDDLQHLSLEAIAAQLYMTSRTLRRKLVAEGAQFQGLKDSVRRERAIYWLSQDATIKEVALRTGYTETASFIRAFRNWTGFSPGQYKKGLSPGHH